MSAEASISVRSIRCPQCGKALTADSWGAGTETVACPGCGSELGAQIFPAIAQPAPANATGERATEGEAVCFFHPEKKAALSCERCGRFLCELCDLPLGVRHLCPACIGGGIGTEKLPELITRRVCWTRVSLLLGLLPPVVALSVVFSPVLVVTGPGAIIAGVYSWNKPGSLVRGRRRWEAALGMVLGLFQVGLVGWSIVFVWKVTPHV
jgi:ribosomal protein S27E